MRLFGFEVSVKKRLPLQAVYPTGAYGTGGWQTVHIGGDGPGGWFQRDINISPERVQSNWAWWACSTLIANDIGKMRIKLMERDALGIWTEVDVPAFSPVLRKPNNYQTRQQFIECWMHSKIGPQGNTYVLLERDRRDVVIAQHVLDPCRTKPLVAPNGEVYYELGEDRLARVPSEDGPIVVPASEIIHDRTNCLFHPLVGISAIFATGLAASQGLKIQEMSATFFANMSRPSGILSTPGFLDQPQAEEYKRRWNENHGPGRVGQTAVLGNGLKYEAIAQNAKESQLTEQLKLSAEMICSALHVPAYKVGIGPMPPYQNALVLNQIYYDDCLQTNVEAIEALEDEALGLHDVQGHVYGTELDTDALLRMDESALTEVVVKQTGAGIRKIDEARKRFNLGPVPGGDSSYLQQQNFSLSALAKRDQSADPFGNATAPAPDANPPPTKGIETILVGMVDSQKNFETAVSDRLAGLEKRAETDRAQDGQIEGARLFAETLLKQLEAEPAFG